MPNTMPTFTTVLQLYDQPIFPVSCRKNISLINLNALLNHASRYLIGLSGYQMYINRQKRGLST